MKHKFADMIKQEKTPIAEIEKVLDRDVERRKHLESSLNLVGKALAQAVRDKIRSFFSVEEQQKWANVRTPGDHDFALIITPPWSCHYAF